MQDRVETNGQTDATDSFTFPANAIGNQFRIYTLNNWWKIGRKSAYCAPKRTHLCGF